MNTESHNSNWLWRIALILIPLLVFAVSIRPIFHCTIDDAFISFRYAHNLAQGHGLVYNPGERVEGFSCPSWIFLLAIFDLIGANMVLTSKIIGVFCSGATLVMIGHIGREQLNMSPVTTLVALVYVASNIGFTFYAISGMETALYTAGITLTCLLLGNGRFYAAAVVLAVVALTRPEGILYGAALGGVALVVTRNIKKTAAVCAIPLGAYLIYLIFRYGYYGTLLPNTHLAKVSRFDASLAGVVEQTKGFLLYTFQHPTMGVHMIALVWVGLAGTFGRRSLALPLALASAMFFVWYTGKDWMSFWRFYQPVLPLAGLLAFAALDLAARGSGTRWRRLLLIAMAVFFLVPNVRRTADDVRELNHGERHNPSMHAKPHIEVGRYLAEHFSADDTVVVNEIGAIGYYSGCRVIDMLGLIDREIPHLIHTKRYKEYGAFVMAQKPSMVMVNDVQHRGDTEMHPIHTAILDAVVESGAYEEGPVFPLNSFKNLISYVRKPDQESVSPTPPQTRLTPPGSP